ncbi:MAG: hypothetical protein VYE15_01360 [Myxococcota bacterium]|nr:hypothetical protein [Myxococcota bacterium]
MVSAPFHTGDLPSPIRGVLGLITLGLALLVLSGCDGQRSPTHTPSLCPDGARFAVADDGRAACVFHRLHLPDSSGLHVVCDELEDGYFSYTWPENAWTVGYRCPVGAVRGMDEDGYASCRFGGVTAPRTNGSSPTCGMTHRGKLGYWWRLDTAASFTGQLGRRLATIEPTSFPAWN